MGASQGALADGSRARSWINSIRKASKGDLFETRLGTRGQPRALRGCRVLGSRCALVFASENTLPLERNSRILFSEKL
jgi:hypothetical protein